MKKLSLSLVLGVSLGAAAQAQFYSAGSGITIYALSGNGSLAAGYNATQYLLYPVGGSVQLIGGLAPGSGIGGTPEVDNAGTKVVGTAQNTTTGMAEMSIYDIAAGQWTNLGNIGSFSGNQASSGWALSGDGSTAGGLGWISAGSANAMLWTASTGPTSLGTTVTGRSTRANSLNFDGTVVVGWQDSITGFRQGARWVNGVQTNLFTDATSGSALSEASDVSADGSVVVGSGNSGNGFRAWRWTPLTGGERLPTIFNTAWRGASTAVSDDGATVVGFYRPFPGPATFGRGFIWTAARGMVDLNNLGIAAGTVTLALPLAISADGKTIAGQGSGGVGFVLQAPQVSGTVTLSSDFQGPTAGEKVTVSFRNSAGTTIEVNRNVTLDANGGYSLRT